MIQTSLIIVACASSTFITAISLAAIATNGKLGQGGPYYIISRTLGLEVGGALGLLYYLGTTMACSMCVLGGVETFLLSIRGDYSSALIETTNGALGGSYESIEGDFELDGDGLARRFLLENMNNEDQMNMNVNMQQMQMGGQVPLPTMPMPDGAVLATSMEDMPMPMAVMVEQELLPSTLKYIIDTQNLSMFLVFALTLFVATGYKSALNVSSHLFLILMLICICSSGIGCLLFASNRGYTGELEPWDKLYLDNIYPRYEPDPITGITPTFISLLALFYPSVTGIMAGSHNSENLANPAKSIPRGTISAIVCSTLIYVGFSLLFGTSMSNQVLKNRKFVVAAVAYPTSMVVKVGVLVSVIGAALGYMSSATNIIAAIANDESSMPILKFIRKGRIISGSAKQDLLGKGHDLENTGVVNKRALVLTWALVSIQTLLAGNLEGISPLMTMCYLLMYAGINFSCFLLGVIQPPGFRPTFKYFHWGVSLIGFLWCLGFALIIEPVMLCLALAMFLILLTYNSNMIEKRKDFGDVFDSLKYNVVTQTLQSLSNTTTADLNAKNWRPQLLTFVDMNSFGLPTNLYLLSLATQLKGGKGINIVVGLILRDLCQGQTQLDGHHQGMEDEHIGEVLSEGKESLRSYMMHEKMDGFPQVSITTRGGMCDAAWSAILHSGLGPLSPNTILLSFPSKHQRNGSDQYWSEQGFLRMVAGIKNMKVALMIFRGNHQYPSSTQLVTSGMIDVWWIIHDGGLLLLIPHILSKNAVWGKGGARLRIFAVLTKNADPDKFEAKVKKHLAGARIVATVIVVNMSAFSLPCDMRGSKSRDKFGCHVSDNLVPNEQTLDEAFSEGTDAEYSYVRLGEQFGADMGNDDNDDHTDDLTLDTKASGHIDSIDAQSGLQEIHAKQERLKNASGLNEMMRLHSSCSNLVITNMPQIQSQYACDFFDYVDTLCDGLDNCLLIRGSGKEVITNYA